MTIWTKVQNSIKKGIIVRLDFNSNRVGYVFALGEKVIFVVARHQEFDDRKNLTNFIQHISHEEEFEERNIKAARAADLRELFTMLPIMSKNIIDGKGQVIYDT